MTASPSPSDQLPSQSSPKDNSILAKVLFADMESLARLGIDPRPLQCLLTEQDSWSDLFRRCCQLVKERAPPLLTSQQLQSFLFSVWKLQPLLPNGNSIPVDMLVEPPFQFYVGGCRRFVLNPTSSVTVACSDSFGFSSKTTKALIPLIPDTKGTSTVRPQIDTLVFEGGGVKGLAFPSALRILQASGLLGQITKFAGTSAGSIAAGLLAIGYSVSELLQIMEKSDFGKFKDGPSSLSLAAPSLIRTYGIHKGTYFLNWFRELVQQKMGDPDCTLSQIYERRRVTVVVTGTCLETKSTEYFHWISHPDMPLALAVRISMSIPLFFSAVEYQGKHWVDGGVLNNYPISIFDGLFIGDERSHDAPARMNVLGLRLLTSDEIISRMRGDRCATLSERTIDTVFNLTEALIAGMLDTIRDLRLKSDDQYRTIPINTATIPSTQFVLDASQKQHLLDAGTNAALEYLLRNNLPVCPTTPPTWRVVIMSVKQLFEDCKKKQKTSCAFKIGRYRLSTSAEGGLEPFWAHEISLNSLSFFHRCITFRLATSKSASGKESSIIGRARIHFDEIFADALRFTHPQIISIPIDLAKTPGSDDNKMAALSRLSLDPGSSSLPFPFSVDAGTVLELAVQCVYPGRCQDFHRTSLKYMTPSARILLVCVESGHGLVSRDSNGLSDPYVVVTFQHKTQKTTIFNQTLDPYWDETLIFPISLEISSWTIHFHVYDFDPGSRDDSMGVGAIHIANQVNSEPLSFPHFLDVQLETAPKHSKPVSGFLRIALDIEDSLSIITMSTLKILIQPEEWFARYIPSYLNSATYITVKVLPTHGIVEIRETVQSKLITRVALEHRALVQRRLKRWHFYRTDSNGGLERINDPIRVSDMLIQGSHFVFARRTQTSVPAAS